MKNLPLIIIGLVEMPDYEYNCEPAIVLDSMFNPPTGVNFMSMEQFMGGE